MIDILRKVNKVLFYIAIVITIYVPIKIYLDCKEQKEFQRSMICDGYAYDQDKAPAHCK